MIARARTSALAPVLLLLLATGCGDGDDPAPAGAPPVPLTVTLAGVGVGAVSSDPAGIACGADCTEDFAAGTTVTLTAAAGTGSVFAGWTGGGCTGTGPCVVSLGGATTVTATFLSEHALSVVRAGAGTGTVTSAPAGIACGLDCTEAYAYGTVVTLAAAPDPASTFDGWTGGGCTGTGGCVVTVVQATTVTATFGP